MHLKFLPHGKGSAGAAVDYLVGERDAEGQEREGVEILRGNPDMVAAVADSLEFERRYTSAVIAWAPDDRAPDEQIEAVLDEFEKTGVGGAGTGPLRVDGGPAPRARGRRARTRAGRAVRPGDGPEPEHRAAGLAADLRPVARRVQPRARLEPTGRPGAGQGATAGPSGLHRGIKTAGRARTRSRPPHPDPRLPGEARRARRGAEPRRRGLRP